MSKGESKATKLHNPLHVTIVLALLAAICIGLFESNVFQSEESQKEYQEASKAAEAAKNYSHKIAEDANSSKEDKYRKQAHRNTEHQQSVREIFRYLINLRTLPVQQKICNWSNSYNREGSKKCLRQD